MAVIRVEHGPFQVQDEIAALTSGRTDIGGIGLFMGTVRGSANGRELRSMTLEHYPGMTERALAGLASAAEQRWPLQGCVIIHRVGELLPGDPIVLVAAASTHRQAALDATAFLIDWLKTRAPFWKKEAFTDGTSKWVDARESDDSAAARWGVMPEPV